MYVHKRQLISSGILYLPCSSTHSCLGLAEDHPGVFAAKTTQTMIEGKAHYRAVRGHQLTCEALWRTKWQLFESWLADKGLQTDAHITNLAQKVSDLFNTDKKHEVREDFRTAVDNLAKTMRSEPVHTLLQEFDDAHSSNPNFKFWSTYFNMVEILLDFIRVQREGDWNLHLEAFGAMLPWLTYDHTNYARWGPVYLADMKNLKESALDVHSEFMNGNVVVKRTK